MTTLLSKPAVKLTNVTKSIESGLKSQAKEHCTLKASLATFETRRSRQGSAPGPGSLCSISGETDHAVSSCGAEDQFPADLVTSQVPQPLMLLLDMGEADLNRSLLISKQLMKILLSCSLKTTMCITTSISMLSMTMLIVSSKAASGARMEATCDVYLLTPGIQATKREGPSP